jgi:hypothetical protein
VSVRLLALFSLLISSEAFAGALPTFLRDGSTRFLSRTMGNACYTMDSVQEGLPCNPAFIAKDDKPHFDGDLIIGSNVDYLHDLENLLNGDSNETTVAKVFDKRDASQAEASVEVAYLRSTWGFSFEPYRLVYYSTVQNPSLPVVDFILAQQQSAKFQLSTYSSKNFYAGIQMRYTHLHFIGNNFSLSEAFAGDSKDLFQPQDQDMLFIEPGVVYALEDTPFQPQFSAMLTEWGVTSHKSEQFPIEPTGMLGASIKPPVPLGVLEVGLQLATNIETESWEQALRGAISYRMGILQAVISASEIDQGAGFIITYKEFVSGLSYWRQPQVSGVFIQFGVTL